MKLRARLVRFFRADIYKRLWRYARPYRMSMIVVVVLTQIVAGIALLTPWPMKLLVDSGISHHRLPGWLTTWFPFLRSGSARQVMAPRSRAASRTGGRRC